MEIKSLRDELNKWQNSKGGKTSWGQLARKSGVSASNIRKIAKNEVDNPTFETTKNLLVAIYPFEKAMIYDFLRQYWPEQAAAWRLETEPRQSKAHTPSFKFTDDPLCFRLFKLAMTEVFDPYSLVDHIGKTELEKKLKLLKEAGFAEIDENGVLQRAKNVNHLFTRDIESLRQEYLYILDIVMSKLIAFKNGDDTINRDENRFESTHIGVNEEASRELDREVREFREYIFNKYSSPENTGDIARFVNILIGRFDFK